MIRTTDPPRQTARSPIRTGGGKHIHAGRVALESVTTGAECRMFRVRYVVTSRIGVARVYDGPLDPVTLANFGSFARRALINHHVLVRHPGAEAGGAKGAAAWNDEIEQAMDAGAEGGLPDATF